MAFGKKTETVMTYSQENVSELAAEALRKMRSTRVRLPLRCTLETPLLVQRWTSKAVRKMLGNMVGMPQPREDKDLTKDFEDSWYRNMKGEAVMPCRIIKACIVEGAISTGKVVTKMDLKRGLRVLGYASPLRSPEGTVDKEMNVRIVRNATGTPDIRSRAQFAPGTYFDVVLEFGPPLSPDKVIAASEAAGASIGLCEWRPEKGGDLGTFNIKPLPSDEKTIKEILRACSSPEDEFILPPEMLRAVGAMSRENMNDSARKVMSMVDQQQATKKREKKANGSSTTA